MTRAYIVGRIIGRDFLLPLVIALKNTDGGMLVDAVMLSEDQVSIVFSYTRSYFHVDLERVADAVALPEVHAATEARAASCSRFSAAPSRERRSATGNSCGTWNTQMIGSCMPRASAGLVMVCFTLPSFDVVFKIIRDRFAYPKNILREDVIAKYQLVFKHDRAGRLVDAQEFKRLRFPQGALCAGTARRARSPRPCNTVHVEGDDLIFDHLYIERRMTPLLIYTCRTATAAAADKRAVLDYGQCIRDLAYTNIFAGDLLLKNFGVTRHGRVIFYDYDELCQVTDCRFRDMPQPVHPEDEMREEAWFYVAENDVFPETFINFLAFDDAQRAAFLRVHGEILHAEFWRHLQQRLNDGELLEVLPYQPNRARVASSA